jgi:hypothetical protein
MSQKTNEAGRLIYTNASSRVYVLMFGTLTGLSGILHGIFETLQGNKSTEGLVLTGIGAITLIPNYLLTGIVAIIVGLAIMVWTVGFIHKKNGPIIFLLLSILLFFVGGGVAQVAGFIIAWAVATQINNPLSWWEKALPRPGRRILARLWLPMLILGLMFFMGGFGIWLFVLPPGEIREITATHYLLWSFLVIGILILLADIMLGFARDIERRIERGPSLSLPKD